MIHRVGAPCKSIGFIVAPCLRTKLGEGNNKENNRQNWESGIGNWAFSLSLSVSLSLLVRRQLLMKLVHDDASASAPRQTFDQVAPTRNALVSSTLFDNRGFRKLCNPTLSRSLDALASGRNSIVALDIEFFIALLDDTDAHRSRFVVHGKSPFALPSGKAIAHFPREIGGHVLAKHYAPVPVPVPVPVPASAPAAGGVTTSACARPVGSWYYLGFFHFKVPPPMEVSSDIAYSPSETVTVCDATRRSLSSIDHQLMSLDTSAHLSQATRLRLEESPGCAAALARDCTYQLFDFVLPEGAIEAKREAYRAYLRDEQCRAMTMCSQSTVCALVELIDASKLVTKEHSDLDALQNLCALTSCRRPAHLSLFDVAIANGICRSSYGSAKLVDMYAALCAGAEDGSDSCFLDELRASFGEGREHNPESDAFMTLLIAITLVQSLSWALFKRSTRSSLSNHPVQPAMRKHAPPKTNISSKLRW